MHRPRRATTRPARPSKTTAAVALATALAVGTAAGCTGGGGSTAATTTTEAAAPDTTSTTEAPLSAGRQLSFYVPAVGDCFDVRTADKQPNIYLKLDCALPHQNEVFATVDYPGRDYPTNPDALETLAKQKCPAAWTDYVGQPYETSSLEIAYFLPEQASWGNGVRHVIGCLVVDPSGDRITGSVRGSGR